MKSTGHRVGIVSVAITLAATWVAAVDSIPRPSSRSNTSPSPLDDQGDSVEGSSEQQYHWVVTRGGQLANSVYDVGDPDELSRYSEFDVTIKQRRRRRKRKQSDDDVTRLVNGSATRRGKFTLKKGKGAYSYS